MIILHHVPMSRSFRVLWLLEELGLDYRLETYSIRDGSMRSPAFLAISPAGRVPALEIDDLVMVESGAIVQYLCELHPGAGLMPAPGHAERPRFLELTGFAETMGSLIENLNLQHLFLRNPEDASPVVIKILTARLRGTLAALQKMLGDNDHLLPSGFSAADVMMGFNLLAAPHYVALEGFPALENYWRRISRRPAFRRAREADGEQDFYRRDFYPVPEA